MAGKLISLTLTAFTALAALSLDASAQTRDVEIYYDRYGREVLVDA